MIVEASLSDSGLGATYTNQLSLGTSISKDLRKLSLN
jgi:hypothetical protein